MANVSRTLIFILGLAVGMAFGVALVMDDARNGGGTYIPKYQRCQVVPR